MAAARAIAAPPPPASPGRSRLVRFVGHDAPYCTHVRLWKILGLATLAGVVAFGVAAERKRRAFRSYDTDELRAHLHRRLAAAG
jgi:hypothetical protein